MAQEAPDISQMSFEDALRALEDVDQWVRGRLRSMLRKRTKRKGRARGRDHQRWKNCYFADVGLFSLKQAQIEDIVSLRNGVTC